MAATLEISGKTQFKAVWDIFLLVNHFDILDYRWTRKGEIPTKSETLPEPSDSAVGLKN
jgi:hypothetical protein